MVRRQRDVVYTLPLVWVIVFRLVGLGILVALFIRLLVWGLQS